MNGEYISIETAKIMGVIDKENKELQDKIDKAINYIYELKSNCDERVLDKIIEILKGKEND